MSMGDLISIHPSELKFPFELRRQSLCSMNLTNKTEKYVAFKVKTTNPKKYCVRPNSGIVLPGSSCSVTVTMQAQKEAPPEPCRDKFLIQSVVAPDGSSNKDVIPEMFNKEEGRVVNEFKMRVIYVPANLPSPVPEGSEEGTPPRTFSQENGNQNFEEVSRTLEDTKEKSSEAWSAISKLTDEKSSALQQNQKLRQELELMRKDISKSRGGGFSLMFVALVGLLGVLIGYFKNFVFHD